MAHLFADAMEGVDGWWDDDSQIRIFGPNVEYLCQEFTGFVAVAGPVHGEIR